MRGLIVAVVSTTLWTCQGAETPRKEDPSSELEIVPVEVVFQTSCDASVAADFNRAVTLLHSFEYPETTKLFKEISEKDPDCAMARWGQAMSLWHPLWAPPTMAELEAGALTLGAATELKTSPREAGFLEAVGAFFSSRDPATHRQRAQAHAARLALLHDDYPDDPEVAAFYALALLAEASPKDKTYANQHRAGDILEGVREQQPYHPGVLHYLIHAYDFPGLAHHAKEAALVYAQAAPDSAHAQHMPSHIFTRLGLWDLSLASNHDSAASASAYTERAGLPGHYDEGIHSADYLMYAMLQTGRDDEAAELLKRLDAIEKTDVDSFKVAYTYAAAPARYALERRTWSEAAKLELMRPSFPWDDFPWAKSIHHFARGFGAARIQDLASAREELSTVERLKEQLGPQALPYWREEVFVQADLISAWIAHEEGDDRLALELALRAADREDAVDKHPVTPGEVLPAREIYADLLFEVGKPQQALVQYERVLAASPNRYNALLGAARAAAALEQRDRARELYLTLEGIASEASPGRDSLEEARHFGTAPAGP